MSISKPNRSGCGIATPIWVSAMAEEIKRLGAPTGINERIKETIE